jgi:hypothetical protein
LLACVTGRKAPKSSKILQVFYDFADEGWLMVNYPFGMLDVNMVLHVVL